LQSFFGVATLQLRFGATMVKFENFRLIVGEFGLFFVQINGNYGGLIGKFVTVTAGKLKLESFSTWAYKPVI
jgi:hypothetical protein